MLCIVSRSDATFLKTKLLKGGLGGKGGQQGCDYSGGPLAGGSSFGSGGFGSGFGFAPIRMPSFGMGWTRMLSCAMGRPWMSLGYPMMGGSGGSWNNNVWPGKLQLHILFSAHEEKIDDRISQLSKKLLSVRFDFPTLISIGHSSLVSSCFG